MLVPILRHSLKSWTAGLRLIPFVNIQTFHNPNRMADAKEDKPVDSPENIAEKISSLKLKQIEDDVASSYILVDIGANLTNSKYSRDLDSVVERAKDAGLE